MTIPLFAFSSFLYYLQSKHFPAGLQDWLYPSANNKKVLLLLGSVLFLIGWIIEMIDVGSISGTLVAICWMMFWICALVLGLQFGKKSTWIIMLTILLFTMLKVSF